MIQLLFSIGAWCAIWAPALLAQANNSGYPAVTLPNTEIRTLHSDAAHVDYKLYIGLPPGYRDSSKAYPAIFMLDADYSFALAKNISEHLSDRQHLREVLLVAIAYDGPPNYRLHRTRDYTPTFSPEGGYGPEYQKYSGGGEKFREFLSQELIPFIQENYRITEEKTLVGHSYGGLFSTWVVLTMPELFSNYIIVSPSLWYDGRLMFRREDEFAQNHKDLPARIYFGAGSREVNMAEDLRSFTAQMQKRNYQGLDMQWRIFDDETHNSVFPFALSCGLRMMYGIGSWMEQN